jgi:hypothetical protein
MQYTISIAGEELLRFEETWPDKIPYRPVESIEFMYDSAGEFYCALAVTGKGDFALNMPHPISLEFERALRLKAEQVWDEITGVINAEGTARECF